MSFRTYNLPSVRNAICSLLLLAIGSLFVPLPQFRKVEKDQTQAFPCQDRACGCRTAEDCWTNCCCFSDKEKLAWAAENGVQPPEWFRPIANSVSVAALNLEATPCACCKCDAKRESVREPAKAREPTKYSSGIVLQFVQQKCRGDIDYLSSRIILTFDRPAIAEPDAVERLEPATVAIHAPLLLPPPTPPPRHVSLLC